MSLFKNKKNDNQSSNETFEQNLAQTAEPSNLYMIHLLFKEKPIKPSVEIIKEALTKKFDEVDTVSPNDALTSFAIKRYMVEFKDGSMPSQVVMSDVSDFDEQSIDAFSRSQLWDVHNKDELLASCKYKIMIFDMMSSLLDYRSRCDLLMDYLEVAVELFPDCTAVWIEASEKLFTGEAVRNHTISYKDRFIHFGVNARFFNIEGTQSHIVDTLGLYAMGLPDIQYHFHGLDPNSVVNHAYNLANYMFDGYAPIKNGETIDGIQSDGAISTDIMWRCQYEDALIQPVRTVLDVCAGEFSAGERE